MHAYRRSFPYKKSLHVLRHTGTNHRGTTLVPAANASDTTSSRSLTHRHSLCLTRIHVPNYQRRACTPSPGQLQCENSYQRFLRPLAACHGHSLRRNDSELLNTFHVFIHYSLSDPPPHYMEENQTFYSLFPDHRKVKGAAEVPSAPSAASSIKVLELDVDCRARHRL